MKLVFLSIFLVFSALTYAQPRPFCFSKERLNGVPIFQYKDTISLYIATKNLSAYKGFDVFAPRAFSVAGRSWSYICFSPAALGPKQVETLATWGKIAPYNRFDTPYFILMGEGAPANLFGKKETATAQKNDAEYKGLRQRQYSADLAKLAEDSTFLQTQYDGLKKDCDLESKAYRATFDELSLKILAKSKSADKWKMLLENEILIAEQSQIFLADTKNNAAGIKLADYTGVRVKLLADLPKDEANLLPQYEQAQAAISGSMEVCSLASQAKTKLADVVAKIQTVRKKIADL
jgi:hypothetical protein